MGSGQTKDAPPTHQGSKLKPQPPSGKASGRGGRGHRSKTNGSNSDIEFSPVVVAEQTPHKSKGQASASNYAKAEPDSDRKPSSKLPPDNNVTLLKQQKDGKDKDAKEKEKDKGKDNTLSPAAPSLNPSSGAGVAQAVADTAGSIQPAQQEKDIVAELMSQPMPTNLRHTLRAMLEVGKRLRSTVGKFSKNEKHAMMELYNALGLDEDEFLKEPNELQVVLKEFTFPPPNMHMMRDYDTIDEATMDMVLGAQEAQRRRMEDGVEVAETRESTREFQMGADRRVAISSEGTSNINKLQAFKVNPKNKEQTARLTNAMRRTILFKGMDTHDFRTLFDAFELENFDAQEVVFHKGDEGNKFYLIDKGECDIQIGDYPHGKYQTLTLGVGQTFGELGVMYGTPRAATVIAKSDCDLWSIERDTYRGTLLKQTLRKREKYMRFLSSIPLFNTMDEYEKARMADVLEISEFDPGTTVVTQGDPGDSFFIIEEGEVRVTVNGTRELAKLGPGKCFGEVALLFNQPRMATVTTISKTRLLLLSRENFEQYLGSLESFLRRNADFYRDQIAKALSQK